MCSFHNSDSFMHIKYVSHSNLKFTISIKTIILNTPPGFEKIIVAYIMVKGKALNFHNLRMTKYIMALMDIV